MSGDEEPIFAALDALDHALEWRDVAAAVSCFVDDDDVTFWGSAKPERAVGQAELRRLLEWICFHPGTFAMAFDARRVRVAGDIAWVNDEGTATWDPGDGVPQQLPYRSVTVLVRRDGRWLIHTFLGAEPADMAG